MKQIILIIVLMAVFTGCAHERIRSKWTDPSFRVFINPVGPDPESYIKIQTAFVESNRFFVVDRSTGLQAIRREQAMIHRSNTEEFSDEDKYAMYGKLYSVGAVIVAKQQCTSILGFFGPSLRCNQYLSAIDTSTGEVIAAVQGKAGNYERDGAPDWADTVAAFNDAFPTKWVPTKYDEKMQQFRKVAAESAVRAKESLVNEQRHGRKHHSTEE